jgi:uncharacterized protein YbcI
MADEKSKFVSYRPAINDECEGEALPEDTRMEHVTIDLTPEQRVELEKITGTKIRDLKISVENLADLAGIIVN